MLLLVERKKIVIVTLIRGYTKKLQGQGLCSTVHYTRIVVREQAPRISKSQICQGFDSDYTHIALHILGLEETWQCLCKLRTGAHSLSNNTL